MRLESFVVGSLQSNIYLFYSDKYKEAVCFDAGAEHEQIIDFLEKNSLELKYIILTHGHFDHIGSAAELRKRTGAKIVIHENDVELLKNPEYNYSSYYSGGAYLSFDGDIIIKDQDTLDCLGETMKFYHTPGHTKGSVCIKYGKYLITGDTLFMGSIGRTDLYGGSMKSMYTSLQIFAKMDKHLIVLPGHGPRSTLDVELKENPYLRRVK